jgi:hypothetical protein
MAKKVELEFEAAGSLFDDLRAMAQAVGQLRTETGKATEGIQADLKDSARDAQQFSKAVEGGTKVVTALGKAVAQSNTGGFVKNLDAAAAATGRLETSVKGVATQTAKASDELEGIAASARTASTSGKASLTGLSTTAVKSQQDIAKSVKLSAQQYAIVREELRAVGIESEAFTEEIAQAVAELAAAGVQAEDLAADFEQVNDPVESLQRQLRAAKLEGRCTGCGVRYRQPGSTEGPAAGRIPYRRSGGPHRPVRCLQPGQEVRGVQPVAVLLGGWLVRRAAVVGLLAGDNEGLQKVIFGFQSLLFATQSLQQFTGGFGDALKTLRATLGLTSTATAAQTAATVASGTATAAAGTAAAASATGFAAATAAVKSFTLSLVTNPIFLVVAALAALSVAVLSSGDDAEKANKQWDDFLRTIREFQEIDDASREFGAELKKLDIERRRTLLKDGDVQGQKKLIEELRDVEVAAIQERARARRNLADQLENDLNKQVNLGKLEQEEIDRREEEIAAIRREGANTYNEVTLIKRRADLEIQQNDQEALDAARNNIKARKALIDDLVEAERDLARRVRDAQREAAGQDDPFERVRIERQVAQEEVDELQRGFERKLAAIELQKRIGVQAWQELSDAEKDARADALIDNGDIRLPAQQQEQINALRLLAEEQYLEAVDQLLQEQARLRIELIEDANERERAVFLDGLTTRAEDLRRAGVDEIEIRRFIVAEKARFERETALANIQLDEQIQTARVNALRNTGEPEKVFARQKELELLAIKEESAKAQLKVIEGQTGKEADLTRANLEAVVAEVERAREQLRNNPVKLDLLDLLGVKDADKAAVQQAFADIFAATQEIIAASIEAQQAEVDARITATDEIISDAQRRRGELTSILESELQAQRDGYANNADAIRAEINAVNAAEKDATEKRKQALAERQQLARKQVLIEAASQAAALATSAANLIASWSTLPLGVGLIAAFAQVANIYAFFAKVRAQTKAASQPEQFEDGGMVGGKRHSQGGTIIEAEEGEYVTNRKATAKYKPVLEAINEDRLAALRPPDLKAFLGALGIRMSDEAVKDVAETHKQERAINITGGTLKTDRLEQRVVELTREVQELRKDQRVKETETVLPDGTRVIRRKNETITIRRT